MYDYVHVLENNGGNNSYQSQQFYNSRDSSRENNTRDQDWYQKLGRGRGRGAPLRPPSGQTRPNGGIIDLLSYRA